MNKKNLILVLFLTTVLLCFVSCLNGDLSVDQYLKGLKVTFDSNYEGGEQEKTQRVNVSPEMKKVLNKNSFTRTGYKFLGWAESPDAQEAKYSDGCEINFSKDMRLYAVWKGCRYTIKYELDEGVLVDSEDEVEVSYNEEIQLPEVQKDGYIFAGWYKESDYDPKSKITGMKVTGLSNVDGALVTLNARWVSKENITVGLKKLGIAVQFAKYNYIYNEEIDFSPLEILFEYEEDNLFVTVPYNSTDFHYTLSYDNGQTEVDGVNGSDNSGEDIIMTIYYGEGENFKAVIEDKFTIVKKSVTVTAPTAKTLTYNGSAQALLDAGSVSEDASIANMQYSLDNNAFSTSVPSQTNAGDYTLYWKVVLTDSNNYQFAGMSSGSVATTIDKKEATITSPSQKEDLYYDGSMLVLANAGSVKDGSTEVGKIQYSTTSASAGYEDTIPSKKDIGNYTVYWKAVITDNNYKLPSTGSTGNFTSIIEEIILSGEFTVNANGDKVQFSRGALYWNGSAYKLEANQYDYRTLSSKNSLIDGVYNSTGTPSGHVGLFLWTNDIEKGHIIHYQSTAENVSDIIAFANGGAINGLDLLSNEEWIYLLQTRDNATSKWSDKVYINMGSSGISGLMLLPDNWELPSGCSFTPDATSNIYNSTQWEAMEDAGAVFIPMSYWFFIESKDILMRSGGRWWASNLRDTTSGYCIFFNYEHGFSVTTVSLPMYIGQGVRLIKRSN